MKQKRYFILTIIAFITLFNLFGCGALNQEDTPSSLLGKSSPNHNNPKGGNLYQHYQNNFPDNLMDMTVDDYMEQWPNAGFIVQSADGSQQITAFATAEIYLDVLKSVEESYPEFDEDAFLEEQAKDIVGTQTIGNSAQHDMTEEELGKELSKIMEEKLKRISAETLYMTVQEITKPDIQNQIASSIASIQQSILNETSQFIDIKYGSRTLLTKKQISMLIVAGFISKRIPIQTLVVSLGVGLTADNIYGQNNKGNAFTHALWAALVADSCSSIPFIGPELGKWWGYEFTAARETKSDAPSRMDLHNDKVGANVAYAHARSSWVFKRIWRWRIPIWFSTSINIAKTTATLKVMSNNAKQVTDNEEENGWNESVHHGQLIYLER
ncbi:MAG: hypothetical protein CL503_03635 [Actinobacteria bacterium]|nr:hypothetical protein [Actinomycetota bacterium]